MVECKGGLRGRTGLSTDAPPVQLSNGQYLSQESHRRIRTVHQEYHFDVDGERNRLLDNRRESVRTGLYIWICQLTDSLKRCQIIPFYCCHKNLSFTFHETRLISFPPVSDYIFVKTQFCSITGPISDRRPVFETPERFMRLQINFYLCSTQNRL